MKRNVYEQIARAAMATRMVELEHESFSSLDLRDAAKVVKLQDLLRSTIDDAAKLFPGGLQEALEPITVGPCCSHPPGSRTCSTCTLSDDDETSQQAIAARALGTRHYSAAAVDLAGIAGDPTCSKCGGDRRYLGSRRGCRCREEALAYVDLTEVVRNNARQRALLHASELEAVARRMREEWTLK